MKYWVYLNEKVVGPYDEDKLATIEGFTPDTLICSEQVEGGGNQDWVKASSLFEFDDVTHAMSASEQAPQEAAPQQQPATQEAAQPAAQEQPVVEEEMSSTQILLRKIDLLTQEIEGMKGKIDETLAASAATQAAVNQQLSSLQHQQQAAAQPAPVQQAAPALPVEDTLSENSSLSDTDLANQAEQLVAQANVQATDEKPLDFLDEIQIESQKADAGVEKNGEEVVLRSALDSLYGSSQLKEQTEKEKEDTFQDLLSPFKKAAAATAGVAIAGAAAAGTAAALSSKEKEQAPAPQEAAQETTPKAEEPAQQPEEQTAEKAEQPAEIKEEEKPAELMGQEREDIINEITAPTAQQEDALLQALDEVEKTTEPAQEQPAPQAAQQPGDINGDLDLQPIDAITQEPELTPMGEEEKKSLDLNDGPQLSIAQSDNEDPIVATPGDLELAEQLSAENKAPELMAMDPQQDMAPAQTDPNSQTVKELIPGKKIEAEQKENDLISQADLDDAFNEHKTDTGLSFPSAAEVATAAAVPAAAAGLAAVAQSDNKAEQASAPQMAPIADATQTLPEGNGFYNAKDMTEVQLKEGSTYLISDFIPPAMANKAEKEQMALDATAAQTASNKKQEDSVLEEMVPAAHHVEQDEAALTMSKVSLENTIKTKRGATMDIRTAPMVKDPADSERLDLSDSDLDINTQHDIKTAAYDRGSSNITKIILGTLVSIVCLAVIYVMLAYLNILPAKFNFLQNEQAAEETSNELFDSNANSNMLPLADEPSAAATPADSMDMMLTRVKNHILINGQTLEQLINSRHATQINMIDWSITTAVEPDNYSVLVKVPPANPQSFKMSYRFNYNAQTNELEPTISDSKNLLDSIQRR